MSNIKDISEQLTDYVAQMNDNELLDFKQYLEEIMEERKLYDLHEIIREKLIKANFFEFNNYYYAPNSNNIAVSIDHTTVSVRHFIPKKDHEKIFKTIKLLKEHLND